MKKVTLNDGRKKNLPDVIAKILIKNKKAKEIRKKKEVSKNVVASIKNVVTKEDKTIKETKENKLINKRQTK